ncbi:hypothetical protein niasHT_025477 [Heterodera trifolii]|uniref:Uncharacterized protein n=1 Tax=Heterodera trifolii TaxID=157864 RepID=A0ABD2KT75_9BILA
MGLLLIRCSVSIQHRNATFIQNWDGCKLQNPFIPGGGGEEQQQNPKKNPLGWRGMAIGRPTDGGPKGRSLAQLNSKRIFFPRMSFDVDLWLDLTTGKAREEIPPRANGWRINRKGTD